MEISYRQPNPSTVSPSLQEPLIQNSFEIQSQGPARRNEGRFEFQKIRHFRVKDMVTEACPDLLQTNYMSKYSRQLKKTAFQLRVTSQYNTWCIIKLIEEFVDLEKKLKDRFKHKIPGIPVRKESENENSDLLLDFYEFFLNNISSYPEVGKDEDYLLFIEMPLVAQRRKLKVYKQLYLKKRSGGRHNETLCRRCTNVFGNWKKRFFTITSEGIFYSKGPEPEKAQIKEMIPFSHTFSIVYGLKDTGYKMGIILYACQRLLHLFSDQCLDFIFAIYWIKRSLKQNKYDEPNRFHSFARVRENCDAKFYVDGQDYFSDMYKQFESAKKQIFITGWMVTPYFVLVRPKSLDSQYRLDRILQRKASEGVNVNIIIFLEPTLALNNDSEFTKRYLQNLHPNIKVLRHPSYILIPFLWSHHQKIVIIDQRVGFLGGLDLCYGRMDNCKHSLKDCGEIQFWEGADYSNLRISDIYFPRQYETSMIDRTKTPRMPWHDIAVQLKGDSVIDLTRHFIQYWNFVNFQTRFNDRQLLMQAGITEPATDEQRELKQEQMNIVRKRKDSGEYAQQQPKPKDQMVENKIQVQPPRPESTKNFTAIIKDKLFPNRATVQSPDIKQKNNSPTKNTIVGHSNSARFQVGNNPIIGENYDFRSASKNFTSSIAPIDEEFLGLEEVVKDDSKEKNFYQDYLQKHNPPPEENTIMNNINQKIQKIKEFNPMNMFRDSQGRDELLITGKQSQRGKQTHQILRSASTWGLGLEEGSEENSIYRAYIELIASAQEYIYIENQFFISVENKVAEAIRLRIEKAHREKQNFKVIIIVPLLPGFQGEVGNDSAAVLRAQIDLQYKTICRGGTSLLEKLSYIQNIDDYIQFYSVRAHDKINGKPVTEILYVHSKLIIVDDQKVLIGSANINDRSMLGTRDSEIAVLIEDSEEVDFERKITEVFEVEGLEEVKESENQQNQSSDQKPRSSKQYKTRNSFIKKRCRKFAHSLRVQLYMEHFGVNAKEATDPMDEDAWWLIKERARKNTLLLREIFACYPDDEVHTVAELDRFLKSAQPERYDLLSEMIVGHVVQFPKEFMMGENLSLKPSQKEYYVPAISFT